ncbi:RNA polymerase sigma factor [Planctomycetota bacterium]|nr:RNA polymerase sigma factor [Planctomycetota bacterium]
MADDLDQWMTQAQATGDQQAFARVVEGTHHLLRSILLRETADTELADELAQEAFVRAWTQRSHYRPGTSPRAWLIAIARNQLTEHHRRADRDQRHLDDLVRHELLRHRDLAEDVAGTGDRLAALRLCLTELAPPHRQLLDLVHGQGLSTGDAATASGLAPDACRQRLSRIQRALRTCIERRLATA